MRMGATGCKIPVLHPYSIKHSAIHQINRKPSQCHSKQLNKSLWGLINAGKGSLVCHFKKKKKLWQKKKHITLTYKHPPKNSETLTPPTRQGSVWRRVQFGDKSAHKTKLHLTRPPFGNIWKSPFLEKNTYLYIYIQIYFIHIFY